MLEVLREVSSKRAADPTAGSVQSFLEQLLVEVIAGNYRHFLHENLYLSRGMNGDTELAAQSSSPPLLASEREVSGLFSSALSSLSPVFWPEQPVTRLQERDGYDTDGDASTGSPGKADFLAVYGSRLIGVEVKRANMTRIDGNHKNLNGKWSQVRAQAQTVIGHMRRLPRKYPSPIAIGLLVVRVQTPIRSGTGEERRGAFRKRRWTSSRN
jgi:hypothetical protein